MTSMIVLVCVLILLAVLLLLRVGVQVEYGRDLFAVRLRVGAKYVQLIPAGTKKEKNEKKEKRAKKEPKQKKPVESGGKPAKKGGQLDLIRALLPPVLRTIKRLCGKLRVDKLDLVLTAGAEDPCDAVFQYGMANAILGSLWQPIVDTCRVVDGHARIEIDFEAKNTAVYLLAEPTLRVGQLLALAAVFAVQALSALMRRRKNTSPN